MPVYHNINENIARIIITGHFSIDELLAGFQNIFDDKNLTSDSHILIDVTKSEELPEADVIHQIAAILNENKNKFSLRLAILVTQTVRFGIARQLSTLLDNKDITARPFYDYKEAKNWLNKHM